MEPSCDHGNDRDQQQCETGYEERSKHLVEIGVSMERLYASRSGASMRESQSTRSYEGHRLHCYLIPLNQDLVASQIDFVDRGLSWNIHAGTMRQRLGCSKQLEVLAPVDPP
jgi:hypothetical protein